ncbi:hypothetical protein [Flavobacterium daejeonense]|uniref:hypothetical protein n=1 Tax=Flavobacterium daejeonense TaxID=350893 RepID=UPI000479C612|nr:hypothetical protein [Flavobacterium daejeonense]
MENQAAILINNSVVKISNFTNLTYTLDGFLYGFTANNIHYVHCIESDVIKENLEMFQQSIPKGYYNEQKFLEYRYDKSKLRDFLESKFDSNFKVATYGDIISIKKIALSEPYTNSDDFGFWLSYTLEYKGVSLLKKDGSILESTISFPESMELEQISKQFYNANIHHATKVGLSEIEKYDRALIIAKIAININNITRIIFPLFVGDTVFNQIKTSQNNLWVTDVFENPSQEDLQKYLDGVYNFSRSGRLNKLKIIEATGTEKLYWLVIGMPITALNILTAVSKLKLLEYIVRNVTIRETILFNNDNEALVLRIVKSVTESQADDFLAGLIDDTKYSSLNSWSLFNRLLNDVDDSFIGIGDDNRKGLVMSLYLIWQVSSYNPYQNDTFSQANLNKFVYNKKFGTNPDPSKPVFETLMGINPQTLDFSASPITFNYISSTAFGFYFDNFDFYNTAAGLDGDSFKYDMRYFLNEDDYPKNKIIAIQDNYRASGEKGLYGTYDYYQPVSLINTNQNAAISIPVVKGNNNPSDENINSLIPIFVLKYIDGKNKESNFGTGIGYFVDIASLFLGGYGLATKIKYLRTLSGFTEAMLLGTETGSGTGLVVSMYVAAGAEAINFSAATISLFLKIISTPANADEPWLIDLKNKVMWLEILSATGSALAEGMIRKISKSLVNEFNANGWPIEFVSDARGINARKTLEDVSGIAYDLSGLLVKEYGYLNLRLIDRIKETKGGFRPKHYNLHFNEENIKNLIGQAIEMKIYNRKFIEDFIFMSCRNSKLYTFEESLTMINYYGKVTLVRGTPTGFASLNDYKLFCNQQKTYLDDYCEAMGITPLEYKVQGSVLFKSHQDNPIDLTNTPVLMKGDPPVINPPDDLDQIIFVSYTDGMKYAEKVKKYWEDYIKTLKPENFSHKEWEEIQNIPKQIKKAAQQGIIHKFRLIPNGNINFLDGLKNAAKRNDGTSIFFPLNKDGVSEVGASIIIRGSSFDILPTMPYKY